MIRPERLQKGDRVRVSAPASLRMVPPLQGKLIEVEDVTPAYVDARSVFGEELRLGRHLLSVCVITRAEE